jgi:NAD(P)-dependent dehydrogenase (short-subunit alcohol dehydrogenase family)
MALPPPAGPDKSPAPDYAARGRLDGRVFVVLGGGNGIGRQSCHALAQAGARIVCVDRDAALARAVAEEVDGGAIEADILKRADVQRVFDTVEKSHGPVRGLVDIVGMPRLGPLAELDDEGWAWQFDMVLKHAFLAIQISGAAIARAGGGAMTFVSSISGLTRIPGQIAYGSAKAALSQLVAGASREFGPLGVRVNAVAPGFARTPRLNMMLSEAQWAQVGALIPLGAAADPSEIASAILFLSTGLASHVTGQTLLVDGGVAGVVSVPKLAVTGD